ncbi:MAG: 50S ribosomal protein L9, partial [Clostridia bacterium]|nr:50S ribosomal protein L9 [Clostridia bacterium]
AIDLSKKLAEMPVKIKAKAGSGGRIFGSVTTKEISDALKAQYNIDIPKAKLTLDEGIKSFGTYEVKAKLFTEVNGVVKVVVSEE